MEQSYAKNSLLNHDTAPDELPEDINVQDENKTLIYSTKRLESMYEYFGLSSPKIDPKTRDNIRKHLNFTLQRLQGSGLDASNLDMLLTLIKDKKLTINILAFLKRGYQISEHVSDDLDKLYGAYAENKDVKAVFVPEFKSENEAESALKTGEACKIKGEDNISIKTEDGIKKLFITTDTYLELFPPVERFITTQQNVGDCFLLAAINSVNNNPSSRHKVLEMFRENPDGTVDVVFGGFEEKNGKIIPKNPKNDILYDISSKIPKARLDYALSSTCEGIRAIEILNEFEKQNFMNKCLINRYNKFKEKGVNDACCKFRPYTEEEIEYFIKYVESHGPAEFFCLQDSGLMKIFTLQRDEIEQKLNKLKGKEDGNSKYKTLILQRWLKKMDKTGAPSYNIFGEDIPKEFVFDFFENVTNANLYCNNGGHPFQIFEKFGFDIIHKRACISAAKEEFFDSNPNKYVFAASAINGAKVRELSGGRFMENHSYSLEPLDIKGERKFAIKDPKNSFEEVILDFDELSKYFAKVTVAKI